MVQPQRAHLLRRGVVLPQPGHDAHVSLRAAEVVFVQRIARRLHAFFGEILGLRQHVPRFQALRHGEKHLGFRGTPIQQRRAQGLHRCLGLTLAGAHGSHPLHPLRVVIIQLVELRVGGRGFVEAQQALFQSRPLGVEFQTVRPYLRGSLIRRHRRREVFKLDLDARFD